MSSVPRTRSFLTGLGGGLMAFCAFNLFVYHSGRGRHPAFDIVGILVGAALAGLGFAIARSRS